MGLPGFGAVEFVEVALKVDEALDMKEKEYAKYLESCDKSLLTLKPGMTPVFFKMRKTLPYSLCLKLENMKLDMVKKKDGDVITNEMIPKMAWICEEVRYSIVDIINPPGAPEEELVVFKKDADGLCSPEIMSHLMAMGVHMDLWSAKQGKATEKGSKKK